MGWGGVAVVLTIGAAWLYAVRSCLLGGTPMAMRIKWIGRISHDTRDGTTKDESYIGDGLYAIFDGWQIVLRAPRQDGDHWVALEPETYTNLVRFAERINGKYAVNHFKALRVHD